MLIGSSISHYKIFEKLGQGGMGVVYRAEDTKLNRQVALKFLASHLLDDAAAKERFLREAKAAAALDHPNICTVYEIAEAEDKSFISMAFLKGETLEERIAKGPLPIEDALNIARQIAEGLQAAHSEGIVHRDIKPANVIVSPQGRVTIMDFGLARLAEASRLTRAETAMGTAAYMSPEQAQGKEVDHRSDIWALGCVLYEMVAGQRPFLGQHDQVLLYEILNEDPAPLTSIRSGIPMELEFIVGECMARDREDRTGTAQEVARKLRTSVERLKPARSATLQTTNPAEGPLETMTAGPTANPAQRLPANAIIVRRGKYRGIQALAGAAVILLLGAVFFRQPAAPPELPVRRFSLDVGASPLRSAAIISPDGEYVLYSSGSGDSVSLWLHSLARDAARQLPGTEGAVGAFWSPDSSSIGFAVGEYAGVLKKMTLDGGPAVSLCAVPGHFLGGSWSPDGGRIVFSSQDALYGVSANGGEPTVIRTVEVSGRNYIMAPHFLPAEASKPSLVYSIGRGGPNDQVVELLDLATGERTQLAAGAEPVYSSEGFLIISPPDSGDAGLRALPFSLETLTASGEAFPISDRGRIASIASDGTLAYAEVKGSLGRTLIWRDRGGAALETIGQPELGLTLPTLSPDGRFVAVSVLENGEQDIWVYDLSRSTRTRVTFGGLNCCATWSVSGQEILFRRVEGSVRSILRKPITDTGAEVVLLQQEVGMSALDLSRDGHFLVWQQNGLEGGQDIGYVELDANGNAGKPGVFVGTAASEDRPQLSPDGRFVAYQSDESGRLEVYVRRFPTGDGKTLVSANGGRAVRWRGDGRELYYIEGESLMAVAVSTEPAFTLGQPQRLFASEDFNNGGVVPYAVSAEGQRFLTVARVDEDTTGPPRLRIVQNWYEEFRDRQN